MARPRTPTSILELRNAFKTHPERKRPDEPVPEKPLNLDPPAHLLPEHADCWREIVALVPAGVLWDADKIHLEMIACLLAEYRAAHGDIPTPRILRLESALGKLGLNPSARAGLSIKRPRKNKYAD